MTLSSASLLLRVALGITCVLTSGLVSITPCSAQSVAEHEEDPEAAPKAMLMLMVNQFAVTSHTDGPRGQSRWTGPGMWMAAGSLQLSKRNSFHVDLMGTVERATVGDIGTPQLFQVEHLDAMHAHDELVVLSFRDVIRLDANGKQELTVMFAPRGQAAFGPVPFMQRESADGNPDAPLGHGLQDPFHDVSTVLGLAYRISRTTLEATAFSADGTRWGFPLHDPDSYGFRVLQELNKHVTLGASAVDLRSTDDAGEVAHVRHDAAWVATSHVIKGHSLKTSFVWGQVRETDLPVRNSLLAELAWQAGKNEFFGRAEALELLPDELEVSVAGGSADAEWVTALTVGYARTLYSKGGLMLSLGGSVTVNGVPDAFVPDYGSSPIGVKAFMRVHWSDHLESKRRSTAKAMPNTEPNPMPSNMVMPWCGRSALPRGASLHPIQEPGACCRRLSSRRPRPPRALRRRS